MSARFEKSLAVVVKDFVDDARKNGVTAMGFENIAMMLSRKASRVEMEGPRGVNSAYYYKAALRNAISSLPPKYRGFVMKEAA